MNAEFKAISNKTYSIKDKNIYAKFQDFKKGSSTTLNFMDGICNIIEKSKNLIKWEDPKMTIYFYFVVMVLFFAVTFLPLRFLIVMWLTYKFYKGQFYHKKRVRNNKEVCKIELSNFLEENKLTLSNFDDEWECTPC